MFLRITFGFFSWTRCLSIVLLWLWRLFNHRILLDVAKCISSLKGYASIEDTLHMWVYTCMHRHVTYSNAPNQQRNEYSFRKRVAHTHTHTQYFKRTSFLSLENWTYRFSLPCRIFSGAVCTLLPAQEAEIEIWNKRCAVLSIHASSSSVVFFCRMLLFPLSISCH